MMCRSCGRARLWSGSLATLAVVAGIFVLVDGISELIASLSRCRSNRGLLAVFGVLSVIVGILLIRHPIGGVTAVALFIGIWLVAVGVIRFIAAFEEPRGHRASRIIVAVVEFAAGVVIVATPGVGYATLALIVGIAFIINGLALVVFGWGMRRVKHDVAA
jgi:uncharacterized membrane protein HdeD (DUF308 family)